MTNKYAIDRLKEKIKCIEDGALCSDFGNDKEVFEISINAILAISNIKYEIKENSERLKDSLYGDGLRHALEIIDKYLI